MPASDVDRLELRAGPRALAHLRERGIAPADVRAIPAAAGGPKGLALVPDPIQFRRNRMSNTSWPSFKPRVSNFVCGRHPGRGA